MYKYVYAYMYLHKHNIYQVTTAEDAKKRCNAVGNLPWQAQYRTVTKHDESIMVM